MHIRTKVSAVALSILLAGLALPVQGAHAAPTSTTIVSGSEEDAGVSMGSPTTLKDDVVAPDTAATEQAATTKKVTPKAATAMSPQATAVAADTAFNVGPLYVVGGSDVVPDAAANVMDFVTDRTLTRLAGATRYDTAIEVSKAAFPSGSSTLFVAFGENFPDGLAAGPAAIQLKGPILLTPTAAMDAATLAEAQRLKPSKIIVVGGSDVVSNNVMTQLTTALPTATAVRAAGADRYETAVEISKLLTASTTTAFVAVGTNFPDALAAGPAAGARNAPLLLTDPTSLPASTKAELTRRHPSKVYVVGGVATAAVQSAIAAASGGTVTLLAGNDRYDTAQQVAQQLFTPTTASVSYASGLNFPDAMTAAPLAIGKPGPILLDAGASTPPNASIDAGRFVSWYYPTSGKVIRYIPVVHPDDDFSAWAENGVADSRRYDVTISLNAGEDTSYCTGNDVSNPYKSFEYLPQPQPTGVMYSDRCKKHRLDSWNTFLSNVSDGASLMNNFSTRTGVPVTVDGTTYSNPSTSTFKVWIGANSTRVSFDLGELTEAKIAWAIGNVRLIRNEFPTQTEGDIVAAGYFNNSGSGSQYLQAGHWALYNMMANVDFGLPGSQYSPVGHNQTGRAFGAWVTDYCGYMGHPSSITTCSGSVGRFQYAFGWLRDGRWDAGDYDVTAGFSSYQSFGKWF